MRSGKNRGMPTLSLRGSVCVRLFLILCIFTISFSGFVNAGQRSQTDERTKPVPYASDKIIIARNPLPPAVYMVQNKKILVAVRFFPKGTKPEEAPWSTNGTGFVVAPGVVTTARHILFDGIATVERNGMKPNEYEYDFVGTIITSTGIINFPLTLAYTTDAQSLRGVMFLRVDAQTLQKATMPPQLTSTVDPRQPNIQIVQPIGIENPYRMLAEPLEFDDVNIGDQVYVTGITPVSAPRVSTDGKITSILADIIDFTFEGEVVSVIENMPINKYGVQRMYRIHGNGEPGYSGGMLLTSKGKVAGFIEATSATSVQTGNFLFILSSKYIKNSLDDFRKQKK